MFKKAVEAKSHQRLSGADRKKLKRSIRDKFPRASDADIDTLLPPKADITVAKFQNRVHVYGVEGGFPMFFDVDGRGTDIFPTVFALWNVPEFLPSFMLKGGEVSRYILGGADLMFPGISIPAEGLPSFSAGEPWAVKVPGNPAPIAVGSTTMSSSEAIKAGLRGKALRITHYYRDLLWESVEGHYVPNAGFFEDVVFEDPAFTSSIQVSDSYETAYDVSNDQLNKVETDEIGESADVNDVISESHPSTITELDSKESKHDIIEQVTAVVSDMKVMDNDTADESTIEEQHILSTGDVDAYLDKCLLQALHTTVKDKDLPMPGSTLCVPHGQISVKEDKYKKETVLISINRSHPDYLSFKPEKRQEQKIDQAGDRATSESQSKKMLEVAEIYKPSVHVNPIFASVGADTGKLYTASEASDIVFNYIEKENLVKPTNKSFVVLDATLCDALFKGTVKKGSTYPTEIHKKDLGSIFISRMQAHYIVTRGSDSAIRKGSLKTIQILTERRQGNKKVTKVSGLEQFLMDAEALASELQKKFACSTSVQELPGKKGNEVLIQGGVIDDVARHLVEQYGVPKRYIEVLDKTKK
ncbi:eukaryotic translation initiation factor 2D isoform X2 [Ricinus communis]|uniref:eukaryotic translation initiation factor 2D isoform X2 n=1 Tax=Ricinus communis TaxID=3988 RepID=UPI000772D082|nr:eukaryotic translation initiation factor 2D isoform X2 [Ricinus communis]|eukprot:XP_015577434.1 eukaryotic translation initiation factor 2D isoform X2 [Ricinus communis]